MRRVHVVGTTGSGKTTVAATIAGRLGVRFRSRAEVAAFLALLGEAP